MVRKILKMAGAGLGVLLVLIILVIIGIDVYLNTGQAQNMIREKLNAYIPGTISWERAGISLLRGRVYLEDAAIRGPGGQKIVTTGSLTVNIGLLDLLGGTIVIQNAQFINPRLDLAVDRQGNLNLSKAFGEPAPSGQPPAPGPGPVLPFDVRVKHLQVINGVLRYRMAPAAPAARPRSVYLTRIAVTLDDADPAARSGRLDLTAGNGKIDIGGIDTAVRELYLNGALEKGELNPLKIRIDTAGPDIALSGSIARVFDQPEVDLNLRVEGDLAFIRDMFSLGIPLSGPITLEARASGRMDNPAITLNAAYGGGALPGVRADAIDLAAHMEDQRLRIKRLVIDAAPGRLTGKGVVDLKKAFGKGGLLGGTFDVNVLSYDLSVQTTNLALGKLPWTGDLLSGKVGGRIRLAGTGVRPTKLTADAQVNLASGHFAVKNAIPAVPLTLSGKARLTGGTVNVHPLALKTGNAVLKVSGDYRLYRNTMDLTAGLDTPTLAPIAGPLNLPVHSGPARLTATISGPVLQPEVWARMKMKNGRYRSIAVGDLSIDAVLAKSGRITIKPLRIDNRGSMIRAEGTIDVFKGKLSNFNSRLPLDLTATLKDVQVDRFTAGVPVAGTFSGILRLTDSIMSPRAVLSLSGSGLSYQNIPIGSLSTRMTLDNGMLDLRHGMLQNGESRVNITGRAGLLKPGSPAMAENPTFSLKFYDTVIHAADFSDLLSGRLAVSGGVQGGLKDISARLAVKGENLAVKKKSIGNLIADITLAGGRVRIQPLTIENGKSELTLTGTAGLFMHNTLTLLAAPPIDLKLTGRSIRLSDFDPALSGKMSIDAAIGGTVKSPRGRISLQGSGLDLEVQKLAGVQVDARLENRRVYVEPALITIAKGSQIRLNGWVSMEKAYSLRITSDAVPLSLVGALKNTGLAGGTATVDLYGTGSLAQPQMTGAIRVSGLSINGKTAPPMDMNLAVKNRAARINGNLGFPLKARYNLDTRDFSMEAQFFKTGLDLYFGFAGMQGLSGQLTGSLRASGNASAYKNAQARLDITGLTVLRGNTQLVHAADFKADFENGRYFISGTRISLLREGYIDVAGSGNISGNISVRLDGKVPVEVVTAFAPDIKNPEGTITLQAEVQGSVDTPRIDGAIDFESVGISAPMLGQKLHHLTGRIKITPAAISLGNITGNFGTGKFTMDGRIELENMHPVRADVDLTAHTLPIQVPDRLNLEIDAGLALKGTPADSTLKGTITVLDGLYYKDINLSVIQKVGEIGKRTREVSPQGNMPSINAPFAKNVHFDVAVTSRSPLVVDNNLALLQIKPELRFRGTLNKPELTGRAEVTQGTITYRNTKFDVEKGVVDFINPYRIEPTIDIKARSQVRQWTITLNISGTPEDLKFQLSSNPQESDADILSLLLLGKTTAELSQSGGASPAQAPEQMLAKILAGKVAKDIKTRTGLNVNIQYQTEQPGTAPTSITPESGQTGPGAQTGYVPGATPGTTAPGQETGPGITAPGQTAAPGSAAAPAETVMVTIGKELSRRLSVEYGIGRKSGQIVQQNTAVYKLLEELSVDAYQDTSGTFGGELRYKVEFR